jgi:uncharacterized membrane protein HdeD (DUF308 family)
VAAGPGEGRGWWIFFGIFSLVGGIVIIAVPTESVKVLAVLIGIWFIFQGLFEIAGGLRIRQAARRPQSTDATVTA